MARPPDTSRWRPSRPGRRAFTLVELLVVIGIIALLLGILLPSLSPRREQANRIKCASNLRQIAVAAIAYANQNGGKFPRTYWKKGVGLLNATKGGQDNAPADNPFNLASPSTPVGDNNAAASLYLLLREKFVTTGVFRCPSNTMAEEIDPATVDQYSNFRKPMRAYTSYSYAALFPSDRAVKNGWQLDVRSSPEWPLAADLNPGKGGINFTNTDVQDVTAASVRDNPRRMARANSNNHFNAGQQVAYVDGHVEWHTSPFAGPQKPGRPWRDNVFANTDGVDEATGKGGTVHTQPHENTDAVLHPGDGAT